MSNANHILGWDLSSCVFENYQDKINIVTSQKINKIKTKDMNRAISTYRKPKTLKIMSVLQCYWTDRFYLALVVVL